MRTRYVIIALALLLLAGVACQVSGCQPTPETPTVTPTVTATIQPPDTRTPTATATSTPTAENTAVVTRTPVVPTSTPESATTTPTRPPLVTATPVLLGEHRVVPGDTLWDIAGAWYAGPGCYEYCGHLKWPRVWEANLDVVETPQVIYPGEVLRIPAP